MEVVGWKGGKMGSKTSKLQRPRFRGEPENGSFRNGKQGCEGGQDWSTGIVLA